MARCVLVKQAPLPPLALSIPEAVQASRIGRSRLYKAMALGELVYVKIGERRLIMVDDLRQWMESHRV